ncbi:MAG TPA: 4-hydroxy-tetrahydrodipicolinate synthase [Candidatus Anaerofilum excrementigallinarum]|nr:4-hydroxy-tetrahydrodipicolinate synthase [Candidatus Anaerofilum excrementigallinarum]
MKKTVFTGAAVAIITPMLPDGSIHYEELGRIIEDQIAGGTDAIVICGTTGEASTMPDEEHLDCIEYAVKKVAGRIPVVAGTGSNDTNHAIKLSQEAVRRGADALLQVTPYYNKTSQSGLVRHFTAIADAVDAPIILYNVPSRTGVNITPATCKILAQHPRIVAIKEASGNIAQVAQIAHLCGDELAIYSGNDDQIVPLLALGGKGVISVLSNVAPRQAHDICRLWFEGNTQASLQMQLDMMDLCGALFCDVNPIPVKAAMNMLGYQAGECRLPLDRLSPEHMDTLRTALKKAGLLA